MNSMYDWCCINWCVNVVLYATGWLFTIELKNPDELKNLMDDSKYEAYLKSQAKEWNSRANCERTMTHESNWSV